MTALQGSLLMQIPFPTTGVQGIPRGGKSPFLPGWNNLLVQLLQLSYLPSQCCIGYTYQNLPSNATLTSSVKYILNEKGF